LENLKTGRQVVQIKNISKRVNPAGEEYFIVLLQNELGRLWDTIEVNQTGRQKVFSIMQHVADRYDGMGFWTAQKTETELKKLVGKKVSVDIIENDNGSLQAIGYKKAY
jgi:hypothetical protein